MTGQIYREPGAGAIEFAKQYMTTLRILDEMTVNLLLEGQLHDITDKRIKRCDYCGYYWRDPSLRNTRKTCSDECKRGIKKLQRRKQRADKELINPKPRKRTLMDDYVWWLEYPYWGNEYSMLKVGWKFEKPLEVEAMDAIQYNQEHYGEGNRKVKNKIIEYDGDDRDDPSMYF